MKIQNHRLGRAAYGDRRHARGSTSPCTKTMRADYHPCPTLFVNWPQFRFDAKHNGCNPYEFILSPATVGNLVLDWTSPDRFGYDSSPAVANGVVYIGSDINNVYALNAATGAKLWSYRTSGVVFSSPAVVNGVVYVGSATATIQSMR